MNTKKIIDYLMVKILDEITKAEECLKKEGFYDRVETLFDDIELQDPLIVCIENIEHIARMIIQKDGAL